MAGEQLLEAADKSRLAAMLLTNVGGEGLPVLLQAGLPVAALGGLEVRKRRSVVLALLRDQDPQAHRPVDPGGEVGVALAKTLGDGLTAVVSDMTMNGRRTASEARHQIDKHILSHAATDDKPAGGYFQPDRTPLGLQLRAAGLNKERETG